MKEFPKINLANPEARLYIIKASKYRLNCCPDGYRLDQVICPNPNFWKEINSEIKKDFTEAALIGEARMKGIKICELKTINHNNTKPLFKI
ncbi:hypothetical protein GF327_03705 [Candidatus Woesearchaeota archaeon]|nr:hypothetical protein [Candidatus Woesearchaeota archaeon]